jgi:hypothetical protein
MPVTVYPALVTGDQSQGYRAELVDFPGVSVTEGSSADLLRVSRERLLGALTELETAGRDWPAATPVEALGERMQAERAILLLVDIQVEETPVRVNISIGDRLLRQLDEAAEAQNMTRSGYIAAAVRQRLGAPQAGGVNGPGSQRLFEEMAEVGRRVNDALGPESAFGRAVAELDSRALESLRMLAGNVSSAVKRRGREESSSNGEQG